MVASYPHRFLAQLDTTHMPKETASAYDHIHDDVAKPNSIKGFSKKKKKNAVNVNLIRKMSITK